MEFEGFLREVAPLLGLQWRPFKRGGIRRKVERRMAEIGLSRFEEYLSKVRKDSAEQNRLSQFLTVTISRFFRDREVWGALRSSILPTILKEKHHGDLKIWSIGCASGEEPYSISLLWKEASEEGWPQIHLSVLATDINENLLERAREGRYKGSSLKEVSERALRDFFNIDSGSYLLDRTIRESVEFRKHDLIREGPFSDMDIVFCRNLAFSYFSKEAQTDVSKKIGASLREGGYLVIGKDESLPLAYPTLFIPVFPTEKIYQKFNLNLR